MSNDRYISHLKYVEKQNETLSKKVELMIDAFLTYSKNNDSIWWEINKPRFSEKLKELKKEEIENRRQLRVDIFNSVDRNPFE